MTKRTLALKFIIFLGVVSLFGDFTYEGARSITGPFLSILGASGTAVGLILGLGELVGYGVRGISGYFSDKTRHYWTFTFIGYIINLLAVPLLAFAGNWQIAGLLIILERLGKGIRTPARDAMLSYATKQTGHGFGFGLHEALDQIGAVIGPLTVALLLYFKYSYQFSFAFLLIPALLSLTTLVFARISYPRPETLESTKPLLETKALPKIYWKYLTAVGFVALGYTDFPFIAFHFAKVSSIPHLWIPFFYSIAMGVDGLSALLMGRYFDIKGFSSLALFTGISALFVPLVFFGNFSVALIGMILWGIGRGCQDSIMRAAVAQLIPQSKRGSAYGLLNLVFGICWAIGSVIMGIFYDISLIYLVIFSLVVQFISIPLFIRLRKG